MMLLVGQGERVVEVGETEQHHCQRCERETDFVPQLRYRYGQFDVVFGFVYAKRYQLACRQCNHGWILDAAEMEQRLGHVPIPFHLRFGPAVFAMFVVVLASAVYAYRHAG